MKIPAEFQPKSWEMPPSARVIEASASVVARDFDGETLNWLFALVEIPTVPNPIFWMRSYDNSADAGFVARNFDGYYTAPGNYEVNERILDNVLENKYNYPYAYNRQFILNAKGELRKENEAASETLTVNSGGRALWSLGANREKKLEYAGFYWDRNIANAPIPFWRLPALEVWEKVRKVIAEPNGDGAFSRQFALMNSSERHSLVFANVPLGEEEFILLLRAFVIVQGFWDDPDSEGMIFFVLSIDGAIYLALDYEEIDVPEELNSDVKLLLAQFLPVNQEVKKYDCVDEWTRNILSIAEFEVSRPTMHEQLEASVLWREWKRNHEKI